MKLIDVLVSISVELLAASVIFVLGFLTSKLPRFIKNRKLRSFFGKAVLSDDFKVVYGMYSEYRAKNQTFEAAIPLYQKTFHDGRVTNHPAVDKIITREVIRAFSYILQELAHFRENKPVTICTDEEAIKTLNNTFISIGGPAINEMTEWILREKTNQFFKFSIPDQWFGHFLNLSSTSDRTS